MTTPTAADRYLPVISDSPLANAVIAAVHEEHTEIRSWLEGVTDFQRCRAELLPYMLGEVPDDNRVITGLFGEQVHRDLLSRMAEMDYYRGRPRALDILSETLGVDYTFVKRMGTGAQSNLVVGIDIWVTFLPVPLATGQQVRDQYERMFTALLPLLSGENRFNTADTVTLGIDMTVGFTGWTIDFLDDDEPKAA